RRGKTIEFKQRVANGETIDELLPEAFAVVREIGRRVLNMRHFDVQLIGGAVLHSGKIAEMKTGEGKTLVATLPAYLNALEGKGVHVVTVNDYLARRDAEWMGRIYKALGMTVGVVVHGLTDSERQHNYRCDITYGTNSEFGFDYLRDNMKDSIERYVQRELNFAIVDEVDSILIDEARTPLIISGPAEEEAEHYQKVDAVIPSLRKDIETKEGVEIQEENQTLATISYQNYFRIYKKLAGMTGTADTEAEEFHKIYKLDVAVVPTNRAMIRQDHHDVVYKNEKGK